jgi:hypothetical protein
MLRDFHSTGDDGIPQTFKQALGREIRRRQIEDEMARIAKASEVALPAAERRQILDVEHTADALATGQTIEHTAAWSRWDWIRWAAFWFLVAGPLLCLCLLAWA